jgi:hypothetical protein
MRARKGLVRAERREHAAHEPLVSSVMIAEVPLTGLSLILWNKRARLALRIKIVNLSPPTPRGQSIPLQSG